MKAAGTTISLRRSSQQSKTSKRKGDSLQGASPTQTTLEELKKEESENNLLDKRFYGVPLEDFDSNRNDVSFCLLSSYETYQMFRILCK